MVSEIMGKPVIDFRKIVLILVVMEDGFGEICKMHNYLINKVLILVVMEDGFGVHMYKICFFIHMS